ncbi:MAG: putative lipid II flippase FtsW [Arenicellales bacterium WSBS_2016_MAG_OTU3]
MNSAAMQAQAVAEPDADGGMSYDWWLAVTICALLCFGIVMVYSSTIAGSRASYVSNYATLLRHLVHTVAGICLMFATRYISLDWLQKNSIYIVFFGIGLLVLVLVPGIGKTVNGSTRWISLASFTVQPSEFVKMFMVIYAADYVTRKQPLMHQFRDGIRNIVLVVGIVGTPLLFEPDLGSIIIIILTVMTIIFLGGVRIWHFVLCALFAAALVYMLTVFSAYRLQRVLTFMNPWSDPYDSGFQLTQALIAFGRGEWLGVGLGASVQKLFYLPFPSTDFIAAVIGEELGLAGVISLLGLFGLLLWRGFAIATMADKNQQPFAARLAQGVTVLITLQVIIHFGVNMGLLPTKGLTLPFFSYGGSSLLATLFGVGLLLAVDRECRPVAGKTQRLENRPA